MHQAMSNHGETSLHMACRAAHWGIASRLVESGASFSATRTASTRPLARSEGGADVATAAAVRHLVEDYERIYLLDQETLFRRDVEGRTPLDIAVARGNTAAAKVFIDAGAEVESGSLVAACGIGRPDLLEMLLERGADTDLTPWSGRKAPLIAAAERGDARTLSLLLDFGADLESMDASAGGCTPLLSAAAAGEAEAAKTLLKAGANPLAVDAEGRSGLVLASQRGNVGGARILLECTERDELLWLTDLGGRNALHFVTMNGSAGMAHFLIDNGIGL